MRPRLVVVSIVLGSLLIGSLGAQIPSSQLVFAYTGIDFRPGINFSTTDRQLLDNRLKSYLLEIARTQDYSITGLRDADAVRANLFTSPQSYVQYAAGNRQISSQGIIALSISPKSGFQLETTMFDPVNGEPLLNLGRPYPSFEVLLEQSRDQIYALFGLSAPTNSAKLGTTAFTGNAGRLSSVELRDVVGRWSGDFGLGIIEIRIDGTATAQLQGSEILRLRVAVNQQTVVLTQDEPNSPKLYVASFPFAIANQIARIARPMSWEFALAVKKDQLIGKKNSTYISIEHGEIVQADNAYSRDAVWTRIP